MSRRCQAWMAKLNYWKIKQLENDKLEALLLDMTAGNAASLTILVDAPRLKTEDSMRGLFAQWYGFLEVSCTPRSSRPQHAF
ncbi:hypothetical protein BV898_18041 [Hypsibius exemplaris]|uniref:Uncharacterized protein n=1 Tax=Hypsibius exemplaris TaxID=2072580 RepID=A0A9X6NGS4_HYPEX|nr:hypothetical protein BV898_18041 [Hypsibius exemplaris]